MNEHDDSWVDMELFLTGYETGYDGQALPEDTDEFYHEGFCLGKSALAASEQSLAFMAGANGRQ